MRRVAVWIVAVAAGIVVIILIRDIEFSKSAVSLDTQISQPQPETINIPTAPVPQSPTHNKPTRSIGSTVKLCINSQCGGQNQGIILAVEKDDHDELLKALIAEDWQGVYEFLVSGKGFSVDGGTQALIIDNSWTVTRVRILEGDQKGKAGWLATEWVRPL